jgi:hypothetical protein
MPGDVGVHFLWTGPVHMLLLSQSVNMIHPPDL